ncbi:hypothetical protein NL108_012719, partial [Boleophthalmus pectinirostris]
MVVLIFLSGVLICFVHPERKFVFVNKYLNWTSAQTYCRESFTDLVTVQDEQENQKLMELAEDLNECVWIGLRHTLHNWKWSKGVPSRSYDQNDDIWADGQPDNDGGGEHCAGISVTSLKGFNDKECTTALPFICFDDKAVLKYIIVEELETWDDAQIYCRTTHDDLATVTKETLLLLVSQLMLTGQREAWIGLYRDPWSSWSDSTSTSFNKWETDPTIHPTDDSCGCLKADTGLWQDISCDTGNQFFCYQGRV